MTPEQQRQAGFADLIVYDDDSAALTIVGDFPGASGRRFTLPPAVVRWVYASRGLDVIAAQVADMYDA